MAIYRVWLVLALLISGGPLGEGQKATKRPEVRPVKDLPTITKEAVKATVLIVASNRDGKEVSQGSGFFVTSDGKLVTNYHVIEGASSAIVKLPSGAFYLVAGIAGVDLDNDLVVLKATGEEFPFIALGDSDTVQVGEEVLAIGSPLSLEATVSNGIISAIRELDSKKFKLFQTTAAISPGSSGGALLNRHGEVIGITSFQASRGQNLNFAVPINVAKFLLSGTGVMPLESTADTSLSSARRDARASEKESIEAEAEKPFPQMWTSMVNAQDYKVRFEGDYAYAEWVASGAWKQVAAAGGFQRCEFQKSDQAWIGTCWSYMPLNCSSFWAGNYVGWCRFETSAKITLVSPTRIEGEGVEPDTSKDFDCGKCRAKRTKVTQFSLVPK